VPEAFGLPSGPDVHFPIESKVTTRSGATRITVCEEPLAYYPEMADICIEFAVDAIANEHRLQLPELEVA
jgi:hypothetical protein